MSEMIADRRRAAVARISATRRPPRRPERPEPPIADGPPPTSFYVIGLVVAVFVVLGLVMVLSASSINEFRRGNSPWRLFNRQLAWAVLGGVAMWLCIRLPYHFWRRLAVPGLLGAFLLMLLPFVPGMGETVNEANAWVVIGPVGFQPSEFLKLAVLLWCADFLTRKEGEMSDWRATMYAPLVVTAIGGGLCMMQGDLGSAIVLVAIVMVTIFIGGAPVMPMVAAAGGAAGLALGFAFSSQRRYNRFTAFLDITGQREHYSYQTYQAMIAIAQGGATGTGPGRGLSKLGNYVPLAHSDFIFAVIAEELGLIGVVAVLGGFLVIAYCGVQVALAARDRFGTLLAGAITGWLVVQTIINVGGVTGLMPVTGLTLPYFSAGGSSLFVCMAGAGLLLNVARHVK